MLLVPIGEPSSGIDGDEGGLTDVVHVDGAVATTDTEVRRGARRRGAAPATVVPEESHHRLFRHLPADVAVEVSVGRRRRPI